MTNFIEQIYRNTKNYEGIVFLDRDGTINDELIEALPTVVEGIRLLNKKQIAVIVITNQPGVARGLISIEDLKKINDSLLEKLKKEDAHIDAIYSCPHHPEKNHSDIPKQAARYRIVCDCRKPGSAMYKKAQSVYGLKNILGVIGDQTRDILAAKNLSVPSVLVKTGYGGGDRTYDVVPDYISENFLGAVNILLH